MRRPARCLPLLLMSFLALAAAPPKASKPQEKSQNKPQGNRASEAKNPYVERFKQLDRNSDGYVTLDEWPLDAASFQIVDRDHDGRLSPGELLEPSILRDQPAPYRVPLLEFHHEPPQSHAAQVRPPESLWSHWATPRDQVRFQVLDRNHDDRLSRGEWMGSITTFGRLDVNGDGFITPSEWPRR